MRKRKSSWFCAQEINVNDVRSNRSMELPDSAKISATQQVRRAVSDYPFPLWDSAQF